jgi:hypothetical protein
MALAVNVMRGGYSAGQAKALNGAIATGLTAAGTGLSDALALSADVNVIGTAAASTGVKLASCEKGDSQQIYNGGANAVKVYPNTSSEQINAIGAGNGFLLAPNTACFCVRTSATAWVAFLSA